VIKKSLGLCLAAALLMGSAACGGDETRAADEPSQESSSASESPSGAPGQQATPEPDLSGLPDVVIEVNGEETTKAEFTEAYEGQFQQLAAQATASGQPLDQDQLKKQVAETLVGRELLEQEADERDIEVSDAEVDKTLADLAKQNGVASVDQLLATLKQQGMSEEDVRSDVESQARIEQLLADEGGSAAPTQAELKAVYAQAKAQAQASGQKVPPFEKVKGQVREQAVSQKQAELAQKMVDDLRKDADVSITLE